MMLKKLQQTFTQENRYIYLVFFFALGIRLYKLGEFPIGVTHDELNYLVAAKSLFYTGSFAPGTSPALLPFSSGEATVVIAEIPALILAPIIGHLQSSLFVGRFIGALLSSMSVVVFFFLVKELLKDNRVAYISAILAAINPWSFLMGRTIFEVNFFVFFYLFGFLVLLRTKGWKIFWSLPLFLLGFFSYTGGQVSFCLFVLITLLYHWLIKSRPNIKSYVTFATVMVFVLALYVFLVMGNQSSSTRGGEIYTPWRNKVSSQVDTERKLAVPSPYNSLFVNKMTIYSKGFIEKYLNAFSVDDLFLNGEFRAAFSYQKHGTFYIIDFLFLLIGIGYLFQKDKRLWSLVISLVGVSVITAALSVIEHSYSQRVGLMYPFLILLVAMGIGYVYELLSSKRESVASIFTVVILALYTVLFANLMHTYFYRFPVYASEGWFFQDRLLSQYINLTRKLEPNRQIYVATFEPKIVFQEYLFYNKLYDEGENIKMVNSNLANENFVFDNVHFVSSCAIENANGDATIIYDGKLKCVDQESVEVLRITRFIDTFANYQIEGDTLCSGVILGRYVHPVSYGNFQVEGQAAEEFCTNWITRL